MDPESKTDQDPGVEMDTQPVTEIPSTIRESSKMSQDPVVKQQHGVAIPEDSINAESNFNEAPKLTIVVFGNASAVCFADENILLGQDQEQFLQTHKVSVWTVSVINMLDMHEGELYLDPSDHLTNWLNNENCINSFILVLQLGQFTDAETLGLEWLQRRFGDQVLPFVMILFTYEKEDECDSIIDDLKENPVLDQLLVKCGNRYHICNKNMNVRSEIRTLLEKIDQMASENSPPCYTADMYNTVVKLTPSLGSYEECGNGKVRDTSDSDVKTEETREQSTLLGSPCASINYTVEDVERPAVNTDLSEDSMTQEFATGEEPSLNAGGEEESKRENINQLFSRLNLSAQQTVKTADVLKLTAASLKCYEQCEEKDLVQMFLQRLLMMDYTARHIKAKENVTQTNMQEEAADQRDIFAALFNKGPEVSSQTKQESHIHPMDVQIAAFHHADNYLRQLMVSKLSQCQYAVPLLLPNPFSGEIEFSLWTFRHLKKSWKSRNILGNTVSQSKPMYGAETKMVAFFRLGCVSSSKSELMNHLINERHHTFFNRNCPQSSKNRLLIDGVIEIAWYCPSGKTTDRFTDCTAFCNLRGDAAISSTQREILTTMATVIVVLLSELGKDDNVTIIRELSTSQKSVIFLLADNATAAQELWNGKYKIGLKDRSQSDVAEELSKIIKQCSTSTSSTFILENIANYGSLVVDENKGDCLRGKETANQLMTLLEKEEMACIKEKYLPCQGKLWHDWCQKNKNLYRLIGHLEKHKTTIKQDMSKIRTLQHNCAFSPLMKMFLDNLNVLAEKERVYFLKWVGILLDNFTSEYLAELHQSYDEKWTKVLEMKKKHNKSPALREQQEELEKISEELNTATFGLEHILREMGQIYESYTSLKSAKQERHEQVYLSSLPQRAAEIIISGYPMELMDGDAAHVPLVWVSAVLDEVINKLGDQKVFVLSVLGIQSSGKSTLLNAMFGLQFAVSAGRCTRGAFMQLVKVSEEMKKELKFDYILVVDTEGLRALELEGKETIHHDNELATFVVGLGNLTLINIFGENPAEMQDILQIVVQAFLRMKKVRLNPSCMFVHQNVGDVTAGEKTMEGRRRLQGKLDEMTKLAAKEEVCDAECFSDIIAFDVQSDVRYFAQLWEGSPPMAPPNPSYSENVHELKRNILSKISMSRGVTLSQFKTNISDLWNALLNENFVFSFRNTLEIAAYRKLENEYSKWTWSLRSDMLAIENKLQNRVINEKALKIEEKDLVNEIKETKNEVDKSVDRFFSEDNDKEILIQWRERFERKLADLFTELVEGTKRKLDQVCQQKIAREKVDEKKTKYENKLFKLSKEFALSLKNKETDEDVLKRTFDGVWTNCVSELAQDAPSVAEIDILDDVVKILSETYELSLICERQNQDVYKRIDVLGNYSDYVILKKTQVATAVDQDSTEQNAEEEEEDEMKEASFLQKAGNILKNTYLKMRGKDKISENKPATNVLSSEDNTFLRALAINISQQTERDILKIFNTEVGYHHSYIQQVIESVKTGVSTYEDANSQFMLKKEFTVDLCLFVCNIAAKKFEGLHKKFKEANDIQTYLEKQRPQYFSVFKNYCSGATSTAVFGEFIVDRLEPSILQAAYDQTAIDLTEKMKRDIPAFSGNRSNLEKHILTALAEEENFETYMKYIHKPREHFNNFITKEVNNYLFKENGREALEAIKSNVKSKGKCVMDAVRETTDEVSRCNGDGGMWLQQLSRKLKDELLLNEDASLDQREITDLDFLCEVVDKGLTSVITKLSNNFQCISDVNLEMFKKKPDENLIEHLCQCCWSQCPFCNAICTNTMEDHDGDHSVRFHRNCGTNGWSFMGTKHLGVEFCTTAVSGDALFFRTAGKVFKYKEYRNAGGEYAKWNITPDISEMPYWKWFVCRFQEELENYYGKFFKDNGEIPTEWREYTKEKAIESLSCSFTVRPQPRPREETASSDSSSRPSQRPQLTRSTSPEF